MEKFISKLPVFIYGCTREIIGVFGQISIQLVGLPPEAEVKVNEKRVDVPIEMMPSKESITLSVQAEGYETFTQSIVPQKNTSIQLKMIKLEDSKKRDKRRGSRKTRKKVRRKSKKNARSKDDLATNPFGEQ